MPAVTALIPLLLAQSCWCLPMSRPPLVLLFSAAAQWQQAVGMIQWAVCRTVARTVGQVNQVLTALWPSCQNPKKVNRGAAKLL